MKNLVHRRDMVTLGARRRHGKTSLLTHMAVALAVRVPDFLGYEIPEARRSLLLMLEDDSGEYQEKLQKVVGAHQLGSRIRIVGRDDFLESHIPRDVREGKFQEAVRHQADEHDPDLIVMDNLAHVIDVEYNDAKRVHELMGFCYQLAKTHNAAIVLAAHPKKEDLEHPISLQRSPGHFFETIMGTSHLINSTGSLWGLERPDGEDYSVFLGGRQRSEGHQGHSFIQMDENDWFHLLPEGQFTLSLVLNTPARQEAWKHLPDPPRTFGYRDGEALVKAVMRSSSTYAKWLAECRRLRVIVDTSDGRLSKAQGLDQRSSIGLREAA